MGTQARAAASTTSNQRRKTFGADRARASDLCHLSRARSRCRTLPSAEPRWRMRKAAGCKPDRRCVVSLHGFAPGGPSLGGVEHLPRRNEPARDDIPIFMSTEYAGVRDQHACTAAEVGEPAATHLSDWTPEVNAQFWVRYKRPACESPPAGCVVSCSSLAAERWWRKHYITS